MEIKAGQSYKHWKGAVYVIDGIATHTETGEELVIYHRRLKDKLHARPLKDFMGFASCGRERFVLEE